MRLSRAKGARLPEGAVSVARPSRFGNPYKTALHGGIYTVAESLERYERDLRNGTLVTAPGRAPVTLADLSQIAGRDLACYCPLDRACHADVIIRLMTETGVCVPAGKDRQ